MLALLSRCAKTISLIAGFLFAILGALWSFLVVERLSEQARALANAKADVNRKIQSLNTLASDISSLTNREIWFSFWRSRKTRAEISPTLFTKAMSSIARPRSVT